MSVLESLDRHHRDAVDAHALATAMELADEAVSENTRRTYVNAWRVWERWCEAHGIGPLCDSVRERDAYVAAVILFLAERSGQVRPSTAALAVHSIRYHARRAGSEETIAALAHPQLHLRVQGLGRREAQHPGKQAAPLTLDLLRSLYRDALAHPTARNLRDAALIGVGVAAALRSSSIAALNVSDVSPMATLDGVTLLLRTSKTDQLGAGAHVPIKRATDPDIRDLDPVSKLRDWQQAYSAGFEGPVSTGAHEVPLFPRIRGDNGITTDRLRNPDQVITSMLRTRLRRLNFDARTAASVSSHSLRASFVTLSATAGTSSLDIAEITGHTSLATVGVYRRIAVEKIAQTDYLRG